MQLGTLTAQIIVSFFLVSTTIARETNTSATRWSESKAKTAHKIIANNVRNKVPKLITTVPLLNKKKPSDSGRLNNQKSIIDASPTHPSASIPKTPTAVQKSSRRNAPLENPTVPLKVVSGSIPKDVPPSKSGNGTMLQERMAPPIKVNGTEKPKTTAVHDTATMPTNSTSSFEKVTNHSASHLAAVNVQPSHLMLSLETVDRAQIPQHNVSRIESVANRTGNRSAVLISNTRDIEVVIIAQKRPKPALPEATTVLQPSLSSPEPSRRFPASVLYQNDSLPAGQQRLPARYAVSRYWPVYLTLTLMVLSVLAICVVCCTSQGRRDMSIQQPKPVQYGQLPPYGYAFSYDMRQAASQEVARQNSGTNP